MQSMKRWIIIVLLILIILPLAACGNTAEASKEEPAKVEAVAGSEFSHVILTERAAQRLDIQSEPLREESVDGVMKSIMPYAAIIYGLHGETWAYIRNPGAESLTFVRVPLTIERIEGEMAILSDGPELGTEVVTVGVAELYGTETGVGK